LPLGFGSFTSTEISSTSPRFSRTKETMARALLSFPGGLKELQSGSMDLERPQKQKLESELRRREKELQDKTSLWWLAWVFRTV